MTQNYSFNAAEVPEEDVNGGDFEPVPAGVYPAVISGRADAFRRWRAGGAR